MTHLRAIRRPRLRCEVTRYVGRHGSDRVAKVVLLGAIPAADAQDRRQPQRHPQFYQDLSEPFYGANRPGMQIGLKGAYDCSKAFSETDLTQDLQRIDVPTLIVHGDDDQIVPIDASARRSVELVPDATLKVYPGAHGLAQVAPTRTSSTPTCSTSSGPEPPAS
jgi:non-heme chloroperoxidase